MSGSGFLLEAFLNNIRVLDCDSDYTEFLQLLPDLYAMCFPFPVFPSAVSGKKKKNALFFFFFKLETEVR